MTFKTLIYVALLAPLSLAACSKAQAQSGHEEHASSYPAQGHEAYSGHSEAAPEDFAQPSVKAAAASTVAITVDGKGYAPHRVSARRGSTVALRFTRTSDDTCARQAVFPDLGIEKALPLNEAVDIRIPTTAQRTLVFRCGMGMYRSEVVIS